MLQDGPGGKGYTAVYVSGISAPQEGRKSAWVWAEDISNSQRVECEVFVDVIQRIEILTTTRVVNVGDWETLDVQARDGLDNVFSSVEGQSLSKPRGAISQC